MTKAIIMTEVCDYRIVLFAVGYRGRFIFIH
jgi:hypothetical protein